MSKGGGALKGVCMMWDLQEGDESNRSDILVSGGNTKIGMKKVRLMVLKLCDNVESLVERVEKAVKKRDRYEGGTVRLYAQDHGEILLVY